MTKLQSILYTDCKINGMIYGQTLKHFLNASKPTSRG